MLESFLIGLTLLALLSAALLHPYGRKLLATMALIVFAIVGVIWWANRPAPANTACTAADLAERGNPRDTGADGTPCAEVGKESASR
jgi:hypothetical protein